MAELRSRFPRLCSCCRPERDGAGGCGGAGAPRGAGGCGLRVPVSVAGAECVSLEFALGLLRALLTRLHLCHHRAHLRWPAQRRRCRNDAHPTTWVPQRRRYPATDRSCHRRQAPARGPAPMAHRACVCCFCWYAVTSTSSSRVGSPAWPLAARGGVRALVASRRGTRAVSSAGERFPDTEEVTGSNPVRPTRYFFVPGPTRAAPWP